MNKSSLRVLATTVAILFFMLTVSGCTGQTPNDNNNNNNKPTESVTPGDYFPLTAGSSWKYQGEGNEYASFTREVMFVKDNLAQVRENNGGTISMSVYNITRDAVTRIFFIGEAYENNNYLESTPNENIIILKNPLEVGTRWEEKNAVREITDTKASINTPSGSYTNCIKVKITYENSVVYEYFKEDTGMVHREFVSERSTVTSSLKDLKIVPDL